MEDQKLLPCPFCGSEPEVVNGRCPWVFCEGCSASGPSCDAVSDAVSNWNMRASPEFAQKVQEDRMRFALSEMVRWYETISLGNNPAFQFYDQAKKALLQKDFAQATPDELEAK